MNFQNPWHCKQNSCLNLRVHFTDARMHSFIRFSEQSVIPKWWRNSHYLGEWSVITVPEIVEHQLWSVTAWVGTQLSYLLVWSLWLGFPTFMMGWKSLYTCIPHRVAKIMPVKCTACGAILINVKYCHCSHKSPKTEIWGVTVSLPPYTHTHTQHSVNKSDCLSTRDASQFITSFSSQSSFWISGPPQLPGDLHA